MKRFLITTAEELTWVFDQPVIFLGEWCRLYERKYVWDVMDSVVATPYGVDSDYKNRNTEYVQNLFDQLLVELSNSLNHFHKTNYSVRFWHIVLGHWLKRYISTVFNRYVTLEQALNNYEISNTIVLGNDEYNLVTDDSVNFIFACNDAEWNNVLYGMILEFWNTKSINIIKLKKQKLLKCDKKSDKKNLINFIKNFLFKTVSHNILPKLSKKRDAFIINSYLPKLEQVKLFLSLGQCPQFWRSPLLQKTSMDVLQRNNFIINTSSYDGFELFVRHNINQMIPICYLEGFSQLIHQVEKLPWPSSPKFIFTSNNFDTDEVFKVWTGLQVEKSVPYFVGQHGNNYGTTKESMTFIEMETCDKFFSWGWSYDQHKHIPAFVFKKSGKKSLKLKHDGGLLLVGVSKPHRIVVSDDEFNFGISQELQFKFVESLPLSIQKEVIVRLHGWWAMTDWADKTRWQDRFSFINVEPGIEKIDNLIKKSRLVVYSYDSTGLLEMLALNIPVMCFWHDGFNHLLDEAKPYYELLRKVNIIVDTPEQAAKLISTYWNDVYAWWNTQELQTARTVFCNKYARIDNNLGTTFSDCLIQQCSIV